MSKDDLGAAEAWIDDWQKSIQERAVQARLLRERLDAVTGTGWDRDRLVKVRVVASGVLADIELDDRVE